MIRSIPRTMSAARSVSEFLTSPSKVAHTLDWKKHSSSVLNVIISKEKLDLGVAIHPSETSHQLNGNATTSSSSSSSLSASSSSSSLSASSPSPSQSIRVIRPINLIRNETQHNRRILDDSVFKLFVQVINNYNVCGIIVGWPIEREGWCGASCGRVLNTLDQLVQSPIVTQTRLFNNTSSSHNNRPIALYDIDHHTFDEDEWGRTPIYTEVCYDPVHISSEEQSYNEFVATHGSSPLITMWNDFSYTHWPHLFQQSNNTTTIMNDDMITTTMTMKNTNNDDSYPAIFG